ncbi:TIR3 [Candida margitis]|uniref:TIR3 n=1 Tax=Candida margitis TaxID=1775924 RepID=UPI002225D2D5|nr:TIR3 [Candida margitis]KAI5967493.1 TIR3 [Candida margitis]
MKFSHTLITTLATIISTAFAADQSDVQFLTALVGDYQEHRTDYIKFFGTADDVPGVLSTLATQVLTYTDTSYTTLLDNNNLNIGELESYATNIPWYTRIESAAGGSGGSGGSSGSSSSGGSDESSDSTSQSKGSAASSTSASDNSGKASAASTTSYDPQNTVDSSKAAVAAAKSASEAEAKTRSGLAPGLTAPFGAVLGGLAVAML